MQITDNIGTINFSETPFYSLMSKRIHKVMLVCSDYDAFSLEEDGRIEEQIFNEYIALNLRHPPSFIHASTAELALRKINNTYIDLIITMLNVGEKFDAFEFSKEVKKRYPNKPVVILTPFSREVTMRLSKEDLSSIDYVFSWLGSADILLAIIKLIEDRMNVDHDIKLAGVQTIILIEDSVRFYSGFLSNMYKIILQQSKKFMHEGLNEHRKMLRMRGRPKILLARNYEEAKALYRKYKKNVLGIISDTKFPRNGVLDEDAGIRFFKKVTKDNKQLPLLLQSSDYSNKKRAKEIEVGFIHKYSEHLYKELRNFINEYFAFGPFKFIDPKTKQAVAYAEDLKGMQKIIKVIPDDSLEYHVRRNHISKWLNARALFPLAEFFSNVTRDDFGEGTEEIREFIHNAIVHFRKAKARGVIAKFDRVKYDESVIFARLGNGYMGGKAKGLAFLDTLIKKHPELESYPGIQVKIPRTVVLSTEVFDNFMDWNHLYDIALSDASDKEIQQKFSKAYFPEETAADLREFLRVTKLPVAVRSSSVLEDSHYQPFAGVYSTYMVPNSSENIEENLRHLLNAIKGVYASVYYKSTKAYMQATHNLIDEEKMGVVLQEVCGTRYGDRFYPTFSGVARSVNFYPIEDEKPEEGIVNIALGLGKHIVEGKKSLRFSPAHPKKILQLSSIDEALRNTQKTFYALDMTGGKFDPTEDDGFNIREHRIRDAEKDESIYDISSVYDYQNNILRVGRMYSGKRIITFENILKYNSFPLAEIMRKVLEISANAMNNPVEIEFAVNLNTKGYPKTLNLLQIRPIVEETASFTVSTEDIPPEDLLLSSTSSLGHGIVRGITDIVYVKPNEFDSVNNLKMVPIIEKLNDKFIEEHRHYILVGPGRWGSSDSWLGIPVKWSQISNARLIVESGLDNYRIDPSQGTHFFQNLTSLRIGYFTINPFRNDGFYDTDFLAKAEAVYEDDFIRHVRFDDEMLIKLDAKKSAGVVLKPGVVNDIDEEDAVIQ